MTSANQQLQTSLFKTLAADADLQTALGGDKIFENVPERSSFPYIVLGRQVVSDWSTATEDGVAIVFFIHIWSRSTDRDECNALQEAVQKTLTGELDAMDDHKLIHLRFQLAETRRDRTNGHLHCVMRFRAVIEPNA